MKKGIHFIYTGNAYDPGGQTPYCPHCGNVGTGRNSYGITRWSLDETGSCGNCGTSIPGVFLEESTEGVGDLAAALSRSRVHTGIHDPRPVQ